MPTLEVPSSIDLSDDEVEGLADVLGCAPEEVGGRLVGFGTAALREYADMMLATSPIGAASEVRERRLVLMVLHAYGGQLPPPDEVGRVFNVPTGTARAMIRNVVSRHRRRIAAAVDADVEAFKAGCVQQDGDEWHVSVRNPVVVDVLNARLERDGGGKPRIRRHRTTLGLYVVPNSSHAWIRDNL